MELFLNAGMYVASGVTSELHALLFSQDGILGGIRISAWAALSVAWVPAFMHGLVGGFAALFLTSRVATRGSLRITAVSVLVLLFAVSAYEIVSLGEAIGMLRRVEIYLAALGAALGVAAGYALERTKRRSP